MRRVTSKDPRKPEIMRAFREAYQHYGVSKITDVTDLGNGMFRATLFKHLGNRKYERLGVFETPVVFVVAEGKNFPGL